MGSWMSVSKEDRQAKRAEAQMKVNAFVEGNKVMVFSKLTCPYCIQAKRALSQYTRDYQVMEVRLQTSAPHRLCA
jgi:thioredoxin-related protein